MKPADSTEEYMQEKIKNILLLGKPENVTKNILAMVGLFPTSFGDPTSTAVVFWDENGFVVSAPAFTECTCYGSKYPKFVRVGDTEHTSDCSLVEKQTILQHPCMTKFSDGVTDSGEARTRWTFFWPRDLEPFKAAIVAVFQELENEVFWTNFCKGWHGITTLMATPEQSWIARQAELIPVEPEDPALEGLDLGGEPEPVPAPVPAPEPVHHEPEPPQPELPLETIPAPPKRRPGRPKGSGKKKVEAPIEANRVPTSEPVPVPGPEPEPGPEALPEPGSERTIHVTEEIQHRAILALSAVIFDEANKVGAKGQDSRAAYARWGMPTDMRHDVLELAAQMGIRLAKALANGEIVLEVME